MGSCFSKEKGSSDATDDAAAAVGSSGRWRKSRDAIFLKKKSSIDDDADQLLHHISGRMVNNAASKTACVYTQQGKKGINQDAMIVWENFSSSDTVFCGIFDGHGPYGHMVAKKVRDSLPVILCSQWKASNDQTSFENANGSTHSEETASLSMDEEGFETLDTEGDKLPEIYLPLKKSMLKSFKLMDKELKLHPAIDCFCSGTTAVTLVKQAARIQQCKGRVFALQDEPEVARVWLPNNDSPGLAMARAFGDFCLKDFGLISVPDIYYRRLTEKDEFIILATDGVWDVISNKEAVEIVASAPSQATAARALVDWAVRSWKLKYPTSKNDDCAVVCLFLEHSSAVNGSVEEDSTTEPPHEAAERVAVTDGKNTALDVPGDSHALAVDNLRNLQGSSEIVPVPESTEKFFVKSQGQSKRSLAPESTEKFFVKSQGQSKRSLAECISTAEDEEWSALEGVTRVNSLLSLPRFLSGDKRSASWRNWL
ncbi:protein-serine/threonine phosphatase [Citrus sinensis]|uniref:Protein-serine/threonine phosphatase n=1 Tax=Citrus sinensis TaxID=2711 RepID=A0ACB8P2H6_CITSI|nr:protein-serine/threonine phosphatase [Citrus sinensis]